MSSGRKTVTVFYVIITGLLLAILDLCAHWPRWTWAVLVVPLVLIPILDVKLTARRRTAAPLPEMAPYLPLEPMERRELRVSKVAVPSGATDYDFLLTATVRWHPVEGPADAPLVNPGGLAAEAVLERACKITSQREPGRVSLVQHELNGALGTMELDASQRLWAMAEAVLLTLADHDQQRLDKLAAVRKDEQVWEHERRWEISKRSYLGEDVLKDPGSTVVWWLARNNEHVERTVNDLGLLAQLSSAANNQDVPERFQHLVPFPAPDPRPDDEYGSMGSPEPPPTAADLLDAFLQSAGFPADDPRRPLLIRQMTDHVAEHGNTDLAEELFQQFDASPPPEAAPPFDDGTSG
jgi:hypothetical protein